MKDKLIEANGNIQTLVTQIANIKKHILNDGCVGFDKIESCSSDCISCKREYFNKLEEKMLQKYIVE